MSDRDAFLAAIRTNPADDLPRLVFADWLDERDDPLGQFIRVQLEYDRTPGCGRPLTLVGEESRRRLACGTAARDGSCPACDRRNELYRQADALHKEPVVAVMRRLPWGLASRGHLRRGFLAEVYVPDVTARVVPADLRRVLAEQPVERVCLDRGGRRLWVEVEPPGNGYGWQVYSGRQRADRTQWAEVGRHQWDDMEAADDRDAVPDVVHGVVSRWAAEGEHGRAA